MKNRALLLSALSGTLVFLSFPNFDFDLLAWIALVPLFHALEEKRPGHAFWLGCLQGAVAFLGMIYWVVVAVHTYGGLSLLVSIPVLLLLVIYLALFTGFFAWAIRWTQARTGLDTLLFAPFLWAGMEYLRSFLLTGFPWGILSYSQYSRLPFIQMGDITGPYGLSFAIVVVNVAFFRALRDFPRKRIPVREMAAAVSCIAVFLIYGYMRLEGFREREAGRPSMKVGLAQGNIDQALKWDDAFQAETIRIYERLSIELARSKPDLIIWPETATPFFFQDAKQFQPLLFGIPRATQSYLLFGSPSYRVERGKIHHYNSAYLLSPAGAVEGKYDKMHLVPYGEYVPLSDLISIGSLGEGIGNFSPGREIKTLSIPKAKFGVAICFEIIFPDLCRRSVKQGADFLVTLTNDAWYGRTSAPYQHLTIAVFRAVENRVWVARAANTGISGFIDPTGRIVKQSGLFTQEALTGDIRLMAERSFYTLWGDVFAWFCLATVAGFLAFAWVRSRRRGGSPGEPFKSGRTR